MKKVILDVDTGIDDAMSILLAVESGRMDVLGITAVNGNVPVNFVMKNTKKILKLIGNEDIQVYRGASEPLLRESHHEYSVHGKDGIGDALNHVEVSQDEPSTFAPEFIVEQVKKHPKEITLIMVGPLTNLALAIKRDPEFIPLVKQVVIMGGLVSEAGKGNKLPTSEFNIFADAEAAKIVFHSGLPIKLVSLDVTMKTFLDRKRIEDLKGSRYYDFILNSTEVYRQYSRVNLGQDGCALHDPLTVGVVLDPSLVKTEKYFVDVETKSELTYGQTICDFRGLWNKEPNVEICVDVDATRFEQLFIDTLKKRKASV